MKFEWIRDTQPYSNGYLLMLGKWRVGGTHYDSMRPRDDILRYAATCKLPGIKPVVGHFETNEEAQAKVEEVVKYWFSKLPSTE